MYKPMKHSPLVRTRIVVSQEIYDRINEGIPEGSTFSIHIEQLLTLGLDAMERSHGHTATTD